jgi:LytR cell envelope-related transcriptional attenuator
LLRAPHRLAVPAIALGAILATSACSGTDSAASATTTTTAAVSTTITPTTAVPETTLAPTTLAPTTTLPPTTTTEPLVTEGAVVLVANAAALPGAAGQMTGQLRGIGFTVAEPTNAAGIEERLDTTKVYYLPEGEAVARSIVRLLGDVTLEPMPTPAWIVGATEALGDATVLVMLGADLAEFGVPPR